MKHFAILTNSLKDKKFVYTNQVADYLREKGCCVWIPKPSWDIERDIPYYDLKVMPEEIECVIVLGGDGTILQAARDLQGRNVPIFSINIGTLGFLSSAEEADIPECLECLFDDSCYVEERMMLQGKAIHKGEVIINDIALNDIIVERSGFSRLVEVKIYVNDELLNTVNADGVIISTPTGSTAYSLSAGGPIVFPQTDVIIITPICPHALYSRSIVISGEDRVTIEVGKRRKTQKEEAMVTFDGSIAEKLETADLVEICKSQETIKILRQRGKGFYQILHDKIGGV